MKREVNMPELGGGPWKEQWKADLNINAAREPQVQHVEDRRVIDLALDDSDEEGDPDHDINVKREDSGTPNP